VGVPTLQMYPTGIKLYVEIAEGQSFIGYKENSMNRIEVKKLVLKAAGSIPEGSEQDLTVELLLNAPPWFWSAPSSSSGKYHPEDEHGDGGLALHSLRVYRIARSFCEAEPKKFGDLIAPILSACLLHDYCRYGTGRTRSDYSVTEHPDLAANLIREKGFPDISRLVQSHMGQWGRVKPKTEAEWLVHMSDYLASRLDTIRATK
jgi:hypothetical protein